MGSVFWMVEKMKTFMPRGLTSRAQARGTKRSETRSGTRDPSRVRCDLLGRRYVRRRTNNKVVPTTISAQADGSGTGNGSPEKAMNVGPLNPDAKVLFTPPGVHSLLLT